MEAVLEPVISASAPAALHPRITNLFVLSTDHADLITLPPQHCVYNRKRMSSHAPARVSGLVPDRIPLSLATQDLPMATQEFGQNHEIMRVLLEDQAQVARVHSNEDAVHSRFAQEDGCYVSASYKIHMVLEIPHFKSDPRTRKYGIRSTPHFNYMKTDGSTSETIEGEAWMPEGVEFCRMSLISCTVFGSPCKPDDVLRCLFRDGYVAAQYESPLNDLRRLMNLTMRNVRVRTTSIPVTVTGRTSRVRQARESGIPDINQARVSNTSSIGSFVSAHSHMSFISPRSSHGNSAFFSARGSYSATLIRTIREDESPSSDLPAPLARLHSDYYATLHQQNIIQPFDEELNWSGKGQHVTFEPKAEIPLLPMSDLGISNTAKVDKVICRRIALARKTMKCDRRWTVADASREVYHLEKLRHFHIVQLVGTYLQGRKFAILMYPVADCHLGTFLEDTLDLPHDVEWEIFNRKWFLASTLACLTSAIAFVHENTTKHMDIKPQNILVRNTSSSGEWRVYLADFGLSRSFASQDHSQTDGPTSRTPRYCSPEVYYYEPRGRPSDIFSLGCVFLEIICAIAGVDTQDFASARRGEGNDESFHANLERVVEWADSHLRVPNGVFQDINIDDVVDLVTSMVNREPSSRPTAVQIQDRLRLIDDSAFNFDRRCCHLPPEAYEAHIASNVRYE